VKQRIKSAGAKLVAMPCELLDKPEAENRPLGGMVKDMKADQTSVEILISFVLLCSYHVLRISLSKSDLSYATFLSR